jgi:heme exporter protein A
VSETGSTLLTVTDLGVARGGIAVLSGVNLSVAPGQALLLRGPNGIGKTSLLRTIAGLQRPVAGRIEADADAIAYASHADGLKPALTVAENLNFWAAVFGVRGIQAALAAMDLGVLAGRPAQNLSAGQKRRVGLARLILTGRRVWLMDEPTVSLDAGSESLLDAAMTAHLGAGGAALIATHAEVRLPGAGVLDLTPFRARLRVDTVPI